MLDPQAQVPLHSFLWRQWELNGAAQRTRLHHFLKEGLGTPCTTLWWGNEGVTPVIIHLQSSL